MRHIMPPRPGICVERGVVCKLPDAAEVLLLSRQGCDRGQSPLFAPQMNQRLARSRAARKAVTVPIRQDAGPIVYDRKRVPLLPPPRVLMARLAVFLGAATLAAMLFINFCHLVFQCGCRSWWGGAAEHCNIHMAGVAHCPWCTSGGLSGYVSFGAIVVVQALIAFWPGGAGIAGRLLSALLAFPVVGGIGAVVSGLVTGYWSG